MKTRLLNIDELTGIRPQLIVTCEIGCLVSDQQFYEDTIISLNGKKQTSV